MQYPQLLTRCKHLEVEAVMVMDEGAVEAAKANENGLEDSNSLFPGESRVAPAGVEISRNYPMRQVSPRVTPSWGSQ
jgi:hypothetical protein